MRLKRERRIIRVFAMYMRTYPPYSSGGIISKVRRWFIGILLWLVTRGQIDILRDAVLRYRQRLYLMR